MIIISQKTFKVKNLVFRARKWRFYSVSLFCESVYHSCNSRGALGISLTFIQRQNTQYCKKTDAANFKKYLFARNRKKTLFRSIS